MMLKSSHIKFNGDVRVQSMQRQSGIFIGERNIAIGWSAHGKENRVIGNISGRSNLLQHNTLVLNDPDIIDTPIDDRDINLLYDSPNEEHSTELTLNNINVNSMSHTNSIVVGKGHINGMDANEKANYTQGNIIGSKNSLNHNSNINLDQDIVDGMMYDQDVKVIRMEKK